MICVLCVHFDIDSVDFISTKMSGVSDKTHNTNFHIHYDIKTNVIIIEIFVILMVSH